MTVINTFMNIKNLIASAFFFLLLPLGCLADRYTVVVSLDGFRDDYTRIYSTPFLDSLAHMGVSATMQPSFPSKTFPNHYTIVTGLVPDHHGIIANKFLDLASDITFALGKPTSADPRFWGGDPIWNTAARQGVKTGVTYWPGSDVKIGGHYPTYYRNYNQLPRLSFAQRINEVARQLSLPEAERPHLLLVYFEEPDHAGHSHSPFSPETKQAVERIDGTVESLYTTLQTLPQRDSINLIVLADHGMAPIDAHHVVNPYDYIRPEWVERMQCDLPTHIWPRKGCEEKILKALRSMPHVKVWKKSEVPAYLMYGSNANIAPIVVNPDCGWMIFDKPVLGPGTRGSHGFDPTNFDMQVPFRAVGPDFKQHYRKADLFQNIHIYPLLCHLLGIQPSPCDGQLTPVEDMLRE